MFLLSWEKNPGKTIWIYPFETQYIYFHDNVCYKNHYFWGRFIISFPSIYIPRLKIARFIILQTAPSCGNIAALIQSRNILTALPSDWLTGFHTKEMWQLAEIDGSMAQIYSVCLRDNFGILTQKKKKKSLDESQHTLTRKYRRLISFCPHSENTLMFKVLAPVTFRTPGKISWSTLQEVQNWDLRILAGTQ